GRRTRAEAKYRLGGVPALGPAADWFGTAGCGPGRHAPRVSPDPQSGPSMSQLIYKADVLRRTRRIVVKVGSAVLSDAGGLRAEIIHRLAADIDYLIARGYEVVLVTSGAIAAGRARLGVPLNSTIAIRQAAAATGQIALMTLYAQAFAAHQ